MFRLEVNTFRETHIVETMGEAIKLATALRIGGATYVEIDRVYTDEIGNEHYESVKIWTK